MGYLKFETVEGRLLLVPDEAALSLLHAVEGSTIGLEVESDGRLTLTPTARSAEERRARGQAFLARYRSTFEALAK